MMKTKRSIIPTGSGNMSLIKYHLPCKDYLLETEKRNDVKQNDKDIIETFIVEKRKKLLDFYFE